MSLSCASLIRDCLCVDPLRRARLADVLRHPWLSAEYAHEAELVDLQQHPQSPLRTLRRTEKHSFLNRFVDSLKHLFAHNTHSNTHLHPPTPEPSQTPLR